jgi:hypothetical protein
MKGLIIDEPWIGLILRGEKIWEMRKTACHHRGRVGLIRKGSGQVVGVADVVASLGALSSPLAYAEAEPKHRIPPERQHKAFSDGWQIPWVLSNARPLISPVPYKHPFGAGIWVNLGDDVHSDVEAQVSSAGNQMFAPKSDTVVLNVLNDCRAQPRPSLLRRLFSRRQATAVEPIKAAPATSNDAAPLLHNGEPMTYHIVKVTGGNVRNNHIYLPLDFFPADVVGGSNKAAFRDRSRSHFVLV